MKYYIGYDSGGHIQLLNYVSRDFPGGLFHGGRVIDSLEEAKETMRKMVAPHTELSGRWTMKGAMESNLRIIPVTDEAFAPKKAVNDEVRAIADDDQKNGRRGNDTHLAREGQRLTREGMAASKILDAAMLAFMREG